jgi:hypothetical protein
MNRPRKGRDLSTGTRSETTLRLLDWTYYDSMSFLSTVLQNRFFTVGLGGTKTLDQTNMKNNGQIPTGERLTTHRLKGFITTAATLGTTAIQMLYTTLTRTTIEVKISGADSILTITLQELFGLTSLVAITPTTAGDNLPFPQPRFHGIYPLNKPITWAQNENVEVLLTHQVAPNAALDGVILKIGLNGILERRSS